MSTEVLCAVIIPVYNGAQTIERCLNALAIQSVPFDSFEIIVVDDGSRDETVQMVQRWGKAHPAINLRLASQANAGPAAARNHGARVAHAPLLLFTDADCAPHPNWIAALWAAFDLNAPMDAADTVAGAKGVYASEQRQLTPRFVQAEYADRYDRMRGVKYIDFVDTYSAAYRRDVFGASGGFDVNFPTASVEDQEFSFRLVQQGYKLLFVPDAVVSHLHDADVAEYWRRKYAIGYWKALVTRRYPDRLVQDSHTPQVLKVQMVLWVAIGGLLPLAVLGSLYKPLQKAWWLIGFLLGGFIFSAWPFVTKLQRRATIPAWFTLPMLAVRALALGLGFAHGLWRFGLRSKDA
ncbi:MAG: glycosyltransferase [Caldilineaceae bacterium]|nr:glycosyltransferase [Caldilineaceae bacterium]